MLMASVVVVVVVAVEERGGDGGRGSGGSSSGGGGGRGGWCERTLGVEWARRTVAVDGDGSSGGGFLVVCVRSSRDGWWWWAVALRGCCSLVDVEAAAAPGLEGRAARLAVPPSLISPTHACPEPPSPNLCPALPCPR